MSHFDAEKKLSAKQLKGIASLVGGAGKQRAAVDAGVSIRTIERWLNDPLFAHELHKRSEFAIRRAAVRLVALLDTAAGILYQGMTNPDRQTGIKLRAANLALTHAPRLIETSEILRRLSDLEERLGP